MIGSDTNNAKRGFGRRLWINAPIIFCIAAVVAVGLALYNYSETYYQQAQARAVSQAQDTIRRVMLDVSQVFYSYDSILKASIALLGDAALEALPEDTKDRLLSRMLAEFPYVHALLFLGENGEVRFSAGRERVPEQGFSGADFFSVQVSGALVGPYLAVTRQDGASGPEVAISRRVTYDGQFRGVAVAFIRLSDFRDQFTNIHIGDGNSIALAHENGRILTRRPALDGQGDFGVRLSATERARLAINAGTYLAVSAVDGKERLFVFQHVPDWPLDLIFGVPVSVIDQAWRDRMTLASGGAGLVCAGLLLLGVRLRRERVRRVAAEAALEQLSVTDFLTGLANRRRFDEVLQREFRRAERTYAWMSVVIIDADHFKALNDRYGHAAGDETLKLIAATITQHARRAGDFAARLGGEEFALVLPDTPASAAFEIMERIRIAMERSVGLEAGPPSTTLSAGVASTHDRPRPETWRVLFERADQALYRAKREGRNRTELAAAQPAAQPEPAETVAL
ncbi:GGDEF domain-containing protein [Azorhizobium oxalatiphilum]|uniref:GGDEF domain-containing protein n=1 Tax=Azorhizobium oxalatiphilum TaxID=980631 RepID=UPI00166BD38B|nr:GGDEF domain-containing protein [Azorhizobium oxalatiphilum]